MNLASIIGLPLLILALASNGTSYNNIALLEEAIKNRTPIDSAQNLFQKGNEAGPITGWFLPEKEIIGPNGLIAKLVNSYNQREVKPPLDPRDTKFIEALRKNLGEYYVYEPKLSFKKSYTNALVTYKKTPVYTITGWKIYRLTHSPGALENFFKLFLAGAHFVILGANNLLRDIGGLPAHAKNNKHSHYTETEKRLVFPSITWNKRDPAPIVTAFLIDNVQIKGNNTSKTFFQLEGWPVHAASNLTDDTYLHAKDFLLHRDTVWNISTYGMSPYSEKRGTTVFLSKDLVDPAQLIKDAKMTFPSDYTKYSEDKR